MAHIVRYSVTGLAGSVETIEGELHRDVNIFYGNNGSGKTTLLRIFVSAFRNDPNILRKGTFKRASVTIHSLSHNREFTYTIDSDNLVGTDDNGEIYPMAFRDVADLVVTSRKLARAGGLGQWKITPNLSGNRRWEHTFLATSRLYDAFSSGRSTSAQVESDVDVAFEKALQTQWSTVHGAIQSRVGEIQQKGLADVLQLVIDYNDKSDSVDKNVDWRSAYEHVVSFLQRQSMQALLPPENEFRKRFTHSNLLRSVVSRIDEVENNISIAMQPRTQLESLVARLFSGNKSVGFGSNRITVSATDKESSQIGIRSLSSGEKHILQLLITAMGASSSSLIIDEPELSLHIDWQHDLVASLHTINPETQLILATHSPEIMAEVDDSRIRRIGQ